MNAVNATAKQVTVVGAGFSGLISAYYLAKAGYRVEIREAKSKAGGLIATLKTPHGLVETAANGLLNSALVEDLFADIGVPLEVTKPEARKRYVVRDGEARRWPLSLKGTIRVAWFLARYLFTRKRLAPHAEETARKWAERVLGHEASKYLVEAALQGIYAGDPGRMSASLIFGGMFGGPKKAARKPRARGTISAREGMGQVIDALEKKLREMGCTIEYDSSVVLDGVSHPCVVATSASDAARVLHKISPSRSRVLESIEIVPVTSATLFFDRTDPSTKGFGCLFPPIENRKALGVLKNDFIFEGRVSGDVHAETWILGGARAPEGFASWSDREIVDVIRQERTRVFDSSEEPVETVVTRWPYAIPHYTIDLERSLPQLTMNEENVWLIGNYMGRIGLAKILERASELPNEIAQKGKWA